VKISRGNQALKRTGASLVAGVAVSVLLLFWLQQAVIALLLGASTALLIARPQRPEAFARLGFAIGTIAGPLAGVRWFLGSPLARTGNDLLLLVSALFAGMLFCGALCTAYGYLCGHFGRRRGSRAGKEA
jgi:asparagine N-glycosylation enzyme membrane subunit Stt3